MSKKKEKKKAERPAPKAVRVEKEDALAKAEGGGILEQQRGSSLATREEDRRELVKMLEEEIAVPGGKTKAMRAILEAARSLAPIFSVTTVPNYAGDTHNVTDKTALGNMKIVVEIFLSAGAYLAKAQDMPKEELLEKFGGWMRDNGYE